MKKSRVILSLVILLAVLTGTLIYFKNKPSEPSVEPQDDRILITKIEKQAIDKICLQSKQGTLTIEKKGEDWQVDSAQAVKINQYRIDYILDSITQLYAEQVVSETPENRENFGLAKPQAVAEIQLTDGSKNRLYLGDKVPTGSSYYLAVEDDPRIFTIWYGDGENFLLTLDDLRDRSLPAITMEELAYFKLARQGAPTIEVVADKEGTIDDTLPLGNWLLTKPYNKPKSIKWEEFQKLLSAIEMLRIDEFVEENPKDLNKYGLVNPSAELVVKDEENTLHLYFGNSKEDKVFFKLADAPAVYAVEKGNTEFLATKHFDLIFKFAYIENIDYMDKIVIEGNGKTHELTLLRGAKEDEEDEVEETFFVNGKEVEDESFRKFYQVLIGLLLEGENDKKLKEEPEVRTTFYLNKANEPKVIISYVPYNPDFYAVFLNGEAEFLINRDQVQKMLEELDLLVAGE
jgi:hypothetical protein